MPTPSPLCLVADGAGPFNPTLDGLDINPGDTVSVTLQSPAGVTNWYLQIGLAVGNPPVVIPGTGTDELTLTPPPLTGVSGAGLVTGGPTSTVTFVFPNAQGRALLFSSTITGGFGVITTTFALFAPTAGGYRVGATGMSREGSNTFGWTKIVNPAIRNIGFNVENAGTPIANNPHTTINLVGITASDSGDGVATFTAPPPGMDIENAGTPIANNPHTTINLVGITAADSGGGVATFTAPAPGVNVENTGSPIANNPHTTINLVGLTATDSGGGVATFTATPAVNVENNGTPIANNPHTTINLVGITAADSGGGVATLTASPGVDVENNGTPIANNPHTTINLVGLTATDSGGGVATFTASPALNFEHDGTPIANNPHTTINLVGGNITVIDAGGGVASVAVSSPPTGDNGDARRMGPERNFLASGLLLQNVRLTNLKDGASSYTGADLVLNERRLFMTGTITYGAASTTNSVTFTPPGIGSSAVCTVVSSAGFPLGGVITITQSVPALTGTFLIIDIPDTTSLTLLEKTISGGGSFNPGATVAYAGSNLDGQLVSVETGGFATGLDFSYPVLATPAFFPNDNLDNPTALIGVSSPDYFNILAITRGGAVLSAVYNTVHSQPGDRILSYSHGGAENWSGSRACYVYQDINFGFGSSVEMYWTAPVYDKVYQANIFGDTGDPTFQSFPGEAPTGICAVGDNTFWVSFANSGKIRHYRVTPTGSPPYESGPPTFVQIGSDVSLSSVVELLFDGKYLWAASLAGAFGTIYQLDQLGNLLNSYPVNAGPLFAIGVLVTSRTRMCTDGLSVWVTLGQSVARIFTEGNMLELNAISTGEARGICADRDGTVYVAIWTGSALNIQAYFPPDATYTEVRRPKGIVWQTNLNRMPKTFNVVDVPPVSSGFTTRIFEITIAGVGASGTEFAAWKKMVVVQDNGSTMTLLGSVADLVPPRLSSAAVSAGFAVTISGGSTLTVQVTQGTASDSVKWTTNLVETSTTELSM